MTVAAIEKIIRLFLDGKKIEIAVGEERGEVTTALENLERYIEADYAPYRKAVDRLWMTYPYLDLEEARRAAELLEPIDRISWQFVTHFLARAAKEIRTEDDAGFIMWSLMEPLDARTRTENIFEIAFDGMERATQTERYEKVISTYPVLVQRIPPPSFERSEGTIPFSGRMEFCLASLKDLRWLELFLYFHQKKRFARCACCWSYFVPKTKAETKYCYRPFCQEHGAQLMRKRNADADSALAICDDMRHLLSERAIRYEDAPPDRRAELFQIDSVAFGAWSELASGKRKEYLAGKLTAEEFLRAIDTYHVLASYDVTAPKKSGKSVWRQMVERDLDFDPHTEFPACMRLDLGRPDPRWQITTSEELRMKAQKGHQSLKDEYGKK